jgi:tetratricopeptide (TPR) repeat protein
VPAPSADEAAQYYAGVAYSAGGKAADTTKAIDYFKAATRADPHQARGGAELGRLLYEKSGQWQQAGEGYGEALSVGARCGGAGAGLVRVGGSRPDGTEAAG